MKVINGKLEPKKTTTDLEFRSILKKVLKEWFDLRLKDLPTIIRKIGIKDEDYELTILDSMCLLDDYISIGILSRNVLAYITLYKGTISNPYPYMKFNGEEYYLGRKVEVEKITIPKATEISEQIYKDFIED